jgi:hypothetical protein
VQPTLREQLLALQSEDERVRNELAAAGQLHGGYHPRMQAVHAAHARALEALIDHHGWPTEALAGSDGAEAAWLVAQHAIGEPAFMRRCRALLDAASARGEVPRWQFAYLDDRIRVSEGGRQRFGTQVDLRPEGATARALEDAAQVDAWRHAVGLGPLAEHLARAGAGLRPTPEQYAQQQASEAAWQKQVGWR